MSKTEEFPVLSVSVCKEFVTRLNKLKSKIPQIQLKEFSVKQLPLLSVKLVQYKAEEIEEDEEFLAPTSAPTCAELFPEYNVCQYCTNIAMKCWCPGSQSPIWEGESEGSQSPIWEESEESQSFCSEGSQSPIWEGEIIYDVEDDYSPSSSPLANGWKNGCWSSSFEVLDRPQEKRKASNPQSPKEDSSWSEFLDESELAKEY